MKQTFEAYKKWMAAEHPNVSLSRWQYKVANMYFAEEADYHIHSRGQIWQLLQEFQQEEKQHQMRPGNGHPIEVLPPGIPPN